MDSADVPPATGAVRRARAVVPTLAAHAAEIDREASFPQAGLDALRGSGLLGLLVPPEHGGLGGDLADLVEVAMELATGCLSTAMIWAMHCQQVDALVRYAGPRLAGELLPALAAGEVYVASVTTEPGSGGHLFRNAAAITGSDGHLTVDRHAPVVTGGTHADGYLVTMRSAPDAPPHSVSLVYLRRDQVELSGLREWDPLGMRGTHSPGVHLTGSVPRWQLVGEPGQFRQIAMESMIPTAHLGWSACWLGAARSALGQVVSLFRSPDRPARPDLRSDLVAERIARVRIDVEVVACYLFQVRDEILAWRRAGRSLDRPATQIHLNNLKVVAAERTFRAVDRLIQLTGLAIGYRRDSAVPLERHFRDLRSASLNYADDRLLTASGQLALLDRAVGLPGAPPDRPA
jgi:acyl-CoA dehydrogenase